ncbi:hypothetical protein AAEO50_14530 [Rossellomorea oryzaecorticis]|uniref:Uncharacterized protein n=1 Tax=Rossellomorea oryzaecorticis TaxID=1396505 RepID=A0ABU9KF63_9BACI
MNNTPVINAKHAINSMPFTFSPSEKDLIVQRSMTIVITQSKINIPFDFRIIITRLI